MIFYGTSEDSKLLNQRLATPAEISTAAASYLIKYENTGIIVIDGIITKHSKQKAGLCDLDLVDMAISEASYNTEINNVVLTINSPGGEANGLYSTWQLIDGLSKTKTVIAFVDKMCASAGYLLASAADYIVSKPDSTIGAIGSIIAAGLDDNEVIISSGEYKAALNGDVSTDTQRAYLQSIVDQEAEHFWEYVNKKRNILPEAKMGGVYRFEEQVRVGLVDYHN